MKTFITSISDQLIDKQKEAEKLKLQIESQKEVLNTNKEKLKAADQIRSDHDARMTNVSELKDLYNEFSEIVFFNAEKQKSLMNKLTNEAGDKMRKNADAAFEDIAEMKTALNEIQKEIEKSKKGNDRISKDLLTDSEKASGSVKKTWEEAAKAYSSTLETISMMIELEHASTKINKFMQDNKVKQLLDKELEGCYMDIVAISKKEHTDLKVKVSGLQDKLAIDEKSYEKIQGEIAVLDALNG